MSDTAAPLNREPPEVVIVDSTRVACDGGGALGHPRVYLEMGDERFVDCGYCDRRFVLRDGAHAH
ncbi:MAG TPA: zinc-finger domain-containing protein [Rhizomicrobium sp.]